MSDHDHSHAHDHDHDREHGHSHGHVGLFHHHHGGDGPRALLKALIVTFIFMVIEGVGGWYANSLALLSDAGHMLTDIGALLLSMFAIWVARRPKTASMSFGFHRAEILGALASGLMIWLISGLLIYEAIMRLRTPPEVQGPVVFVIAVIGLVANLVSMKLLHSEKTHNINVRAAYLHLVADSLGSVGAIIAGGVLWLTNWKPIDPLITLVFAALMLYSSWHLIKEAVIVLMESAPEHVNPLEVKKALEEIPGVNETHDLHVWSVSAGRLALSAHLISAESPETLLAAANRILEERFEIIHTTIQVEHPDRFRSDRCYDCAPEA